jgi:hypothetical protein
MRIEGNKKPIIKFNDGNPVALCNRCRVMMCYVIVVKKDDEQDKWVVGERGTSQLGDLVKTTAGKTPPIYCDECSKLLNMNLNE